MNHELARRYRAEGARNHPQPVVGAVGVCQDPAKALHGEAVAVEGWRVNDAGVLWLTVAGRVSIESERTVTDAHGRTIPMAGGVWSMQVPASLFVTVVPDARVYKCPDLRCPFEQPRTDPRTGDVDIPDCRECWCIRHEDGTVSHGWDGIADAAAAAHTYATAPLGALYDPRSATTVEVEAGWTVAR